jgi:hypothetical protein
MLKNQKQSCTVGSRGFKQSKIAASQANDEIPIAKVTAVPT